MSVFYLIRCVTETFFNQIQLKLPYLYAMNLCLDLSFKNLNKSHFVFLRAGSSLVNVLKYEFQYLRSRGRGCDGTGAGLGNMA